MDQRVKTFLPGPAICGPNRVMFRRKNMTRGATVFPGGTEAAIFYLKLWTE